MIFQDTGNFLTSLATASSWRKTAFEVISSRRLSTDTISTI